MSGQPNQTPAGAACYLCASSNLDIVRDKVRHGIARRVLQCRACGLNYLEPVERDLQGYYARTYRTEYGPRTTEPADSRQIFDIYTPFQPPRIERLRDVLPRDGALLDIGASAGHFLAAAAPHVGECVAIELNLDNAEFIRRELGFRAYSSAIQDTDLQPGSFDLITCFQTMEHMEDPRAFLVSIRDYVSDDGWVYIEVPNVDDALLSTYDLSAYADFWYREPHLFNFSVSTLRLLFEQAGYIEREILPVQRYGLVNHMHWATAGQPQGSAEQAMAAPNLVQTEDDAAAEVAAFLERADRDYREILMRHRVCESIGFLGRPRR